MAKQNETHDKFNNKLASIIKNRRKELGLTMQQLGELVGRQKSHICLLESGEDYMSTRLMFRLFDALDLNFYITPQKAKEDEQPNN